MLAELKFLVKKIGDEHNSTVSDLVAGGNASGLETTLKFSIGCKNFLRKNLWTDNSLVNGFLITVCNILYEAVEGVANQVGRTAES